MSGPQEKAGYPKRNDQHVQIIPAMQDELSGTKDGTNVVFLHTTVDDGDHFQPRTLSGDAKVALATTERTVARNYQNFSQ
jgi:hypothetical protein